MKDSPHFHEIRSFLKVDDVGKCAHHEMAKMVFGDGIKFRLSADALEASGDGLHEAASESRAFVFAVVERVGEFIFRFGAKAA